MMESLAEQSKGDHLALLTINRQLLPLLTEV